MSGGDAKPAGFELTSANLARVEAVVAKYPEGRQQSAVLAVLDLCQRQNGGWLSQAAMEYTGRLLDMAAIRVHEVASFYTMFSLRPAGRHRVNVCTTTPCWLRGSDDIVRACEAALGIKLGETTADGEFSLGEVECLGACVNAPVLQVDEAYYEDLDPASAAAVLKACMGGKPPPAGSRAGRQTSCPVGGATTLKDLTFAEAG